MDSSRCDAQSTAALGPSVYPYWNIAANTIGFVLWVREQGPLRCLPSALTLLYIHISDDPLDFHKASTLKRVVPCPNTHTRYSPNMGHHYCFGPSQVHQIAQCGGESELADRNVHCLWPLDQSLPKAVAPGQYCQVLVTAGLVCKFQVIYLSGLS